MAYYVQAEIRRGTTVYIGWFDCGELLLEKFEEGFVLYDVWPETILTDKKGADNSDIRSICDDMLARHFKILLRRLKAGTYAPVSQS